MGCMSSKEGGNGDKEGKKEHHHGGLSKLDRHPFKHVGITAEDEFWQALQAPLDTVNELSENLNKANESILALCEDEAFLAENCDKDVKHVMKFLKKQMKKSGKDFRVDIDDGGYIIIVYKEEPEGIVGKILMAIVHLVEAIKHIVEKVPELVKQIEELAKEVHEMPGKLKESATSGGMNPLEIAKAVKNTETNVKYALGAPKDIKELIVSVKDLAKTLKEVAEDIEGDDKDEDKEDDKEDDKDDDDKEDDDKEDDKESEEGEKEWWTRKRDGDGSKGDKYHEIAWYLFLFSWMRVVMFFNTECN